MKKLMILGLVISLFAFCGSKIEANNVYAEEVLQETGTSAMFNKSVSSAISNPYKAGLVSMKISNKIADLPLESEWACNPIVLEGCTYTDASGVTTTPTEGVIFAYISYAPSSTETNKRYDCVLYSNVEKIYANANAQYMFSGFSSLKTIDVSILDTSNVTNMGSMFEGCNSLNVLDLSGFDTSSVTDMNMMFSMCESLTKVDVSNFDTSNVRDMTRMFENCMLLTEINVSNFDVSNVEFIYEMFSTCNSLKKLDLSNWDLSRIDCDSAIEYLIEYCPNLEYLKAPKALSARIVLPSQFIPYSGITQLTASNLAEHKVINLPGDKFVYNWKALRTEGGDNGICAALTSGTESNTKLKQLLTNYDSFDAETKEYVNKATDKEDVKIGESITYVKNVMNGSQTTLGNYNGIKGDTGSYMTMSITEESPYLITVISLLGILAGLGYYFYNKKKQAM